MLYMYSYYGNAKGKRPNQKQPWSLNQPENPDDYKCTHFSQNSKIAFSQISKIVS